MRRYKVLWTTDAYSDFFRIVNYINEQWGKNSAMEFIRNVESATSILSIFPESGKVILKEKGIRALVFLKQVTMVYRIKFGDIVILNLFDNRQSPDKLKVNEAGVEYEVK